MAQPPAQFNQDEPDEVQLSAAFAAAKASDGRFRALLLMDRRFTYNAIVDTQPAFSELLGAPDDLQVTVLPSNVTGTNTAVWIAIETSFDGVEYYYLSTLVDLAPLQSGVPIRANTFALPAPNVLVRLKVYVLDESGSCTADLKVYASSAGVGSRRFGVVAFDDYVTGSAVAPQYSPRSLNDLLASADELSLLLLGGSSEGTPVITLQIEESANGVEWKNKQPTPEYSGSAGGLAFAYDSGVVPTSKYARFRISVSGGTAGLKVFACGRGT
jgi:hypothetical protein